MLKYLQVVADRFAEIITAEVEAEVVVLNDVQTIRKEARNADSEEEAIAATVR